MVIETTAAVHNRNAVTYTYYILTVFTLSVVGLSCRLEAFSLRSDSIKCEVIGREIP